MASVMASTSMDRLKIVCAGVACGEKMLVGVLNRSVTHWMARRHQDSCVCISVIACPAGMSSMSCKARNKAKLILLSNHLPWAAAPAVLSFARLDNNKGLVLFVMRGSWRWIL